MKQKLTAFGILALLVTTPVAAQKPEATSAGQSDLRDDMDALRDSLGVPRAPSGSDLEALIESASAHPLGSEQNPVRVNMPQGQRAYLARLRCEDGNAPQYRRAGNFGMGVFGNIIDGYDVQCAGSTPASSRIYMDMYHTGHNETDSVPGYTIVP